MSRDRRVRQWDVTIGTVAGLRTLPKAWAWRPQPRYRDAWGWRGGWIVGAHCIRELAYRAALKQQRRAAIRDFNRRTKEECKLIKELHDARILYHQAVDERRGLETGMTPKEDEEQ